METTLTAKVRTIAPRTRALGHSLRPLQSRDVRTRDALWYRNVAELKRLQPFCACCVQQRCPNCAVTSSGALARVATQTDHKVPVLQGGTNDIGNLQRLCDQCHEHKTMQDGNARMLY